MYRLVISYLVSLLVVAIGLSVRGFLDYPLVDLVGSAAVAVTVCLAVNALFAATFGAPTNNDSALISGLILALIVGPVHSLDEYAFLGWVATLAMASKYIITRHQIHLFNPAALAVVATGIFGGQPASWWVATSAMTPFVIVGGLLVVRKLRRGDLVLIFLWTTLFLTLAWSALDGVSWQKALRQDILESPAWFLGFVMLTEPVTLPPTTRLQLLYGALTGVLAVPQLHFATFYLSPELALVVANGCLIPFRFQARQRMYLDRAEVTGPGLVDFIYKPSLPLTYRPGQYMEWTLDHRHVDGRGKRRYFTLASSPTEHSLRIGVKFEERSSSFKQELAAHMAARTPITAALVAGDFMLPRNTERKLAFIAGGIGITPFRSMVKYLTDRGEDRDVVMLYATRRYEEIIYRDVFQAAARAFRFRPVYVLSDASSASWHWDCECGRIDVSMIERQIPDYLDRLFFVSGSAPFVRSVRSSLLDLGVGHEHVMTDYFSGLAA